MAFILSPTHLASVFLASAVVLPSQPTVLQPVAVVSEVPQQQSGNLVGTKPAINVWNLPNGEVRLSNPLTFELSGNSFERGSVSTVSDTASSVNLWNPTFLGSGGSGAVFSFDTTPPPPIKTAPRPDVLKDNSKVAIKVSWVRSRPSVENECTILQTLEKRKVPHLERCLGRPNAYPNDDRRVMLALTPVMVADNGERSEITSHLAELNTVEAQRRAVQCVVETMVRMLAAGVTSADVQPLISKENGEVLFIDFTEASKILSVSATADGELSSIEAASVLGLCSEMLALIPDNLRDMATVALKHEMENADNALTGTRLNILESVWEN